MRPFSSMIWVVMSPAAAAIVAVVCGQLTFTY
jgi:hypothetical protein